MIQPMPGITVNGGNTSCSCSADGEPAIVWYKDGTAIEYR